jgi:beta-galactosidase
MKLKRPGQHTLEGLQAVAHGSDGVQYFQWRQSAGSLEQFHGAVVGHNNRSDARVFCDVKELGAKLNQLDGLVGGWVHTKVAIVFDWEVLWAIQTCLEYRSKTPQYTETILSFYRSLFDINIAVDIVDSTIDLSEYKLVIAPMLFMLRNGIEQRLASFVSNGGCLVTTYLSGWVDDSTKAYLGGIPEPLRSVLGVVLLITFNESLRYIGLPSQYVGPIQQAMYGLLLILLMIFRRRGLVGEHDFRE